MAKEFKYSPKNPPSFSAYNELLDTIVTYKARIPRKYRSEDAIENIIYWLEDSYYRSQYIESDYDLNEFTIEVSESKRHVMLNITINSYEEYGYDEDLIDEYRQTWAYYKSKNYKPEPMHCLFIPCGYYRNKPSYFCSQHQEHNSEEQKYLVKYYNSQKPKLKKEILELERLSDEPYIESSFEMEISFAFIEDEREVNGNYTFSFIKV